MLGMKGGRGRWHRSPPDTEATASDTTSDTEVRRRRVVRHHARSHLEHVGGQISAVLDPLAARCRRRPVGAIRPIVDHALEPGSAGVEDRAGPGWFVGSVPDGPHRRHVSLRGDIGAVAADRLRRHLDEILHHAEVRHVIIDATQVRRCDPLVADIIGQAHHHIAPRGLITVIGLPHPRAPTAAETTMSRPRRRAETDTSATPTPSRSLGPPAQRGHRGAAIR